MTSIDVLSLPRETAMMYVCTPVLGLLGLYLLLRWVIYPTVLAEAWTEAKRRCQEADQLSQPVFKKGWAMMSRGPGVNTAEDFLQRLAHWPFYFYRIFICLPLVILWGGFRRYILQHRVADRTIWRLVTETAMLLMCETEANGSVIVWRIGNDSTISNAEWFACRARSKFPPLADMTDLTIKMHDGVIISATTAAGPLGSVGQYTRNEILLNELGTIASLWVHPAMHVSCERAAYAVAKNELDAVAPSGMFTHCLHEGLLHSTSSPFGSVPVLQFPHVSVPDMISALAHRPIHSLNPHFMRFRRFKFLMKAHMALRRQMQKHDLLDKGLEVHDLFSTAILHGPDHKISHEVMAEAPLFGTSFKNMLSWAALIHVWLLPATNMFASEYWKDSKAPFYAELYQELATHDQELADELMLSCSF